MLEVKKLSHAYRRPGPNVLEDVTLMAGDGELVSIVGRSGCGKSTLLRAIAGLIRPTSGQIRLDGTPDNLAMVFQDYSRTLLPWLSVRDNVALPLRGHGMNRRARRAAAIEALE